MDDCARRKVTSSTWAIRSLRRPGSRCRQTSLSGHEQKSADVAVYLDSSALVRLVVTERDSPALRAFLAGRPDRVACALARVEVLRSVRPHGVAALRRAGHVLGRTGIIQLDEPLLDLAAEIGPNGLRSLDAVHLAAATLLGDDLDAVVTYDRRMAGAANDLGMATAAPS